MKFVVNIYIVISGNIVEDEINYINFFLFVISVGFNVDIVVEGLWCNIV